jgi:hypothetical protein
MLRRLCITRSFDRGFVDEHDRNVVAYWINAVALDAFQSLTVRLEFYVCFAGRTGEYFQEILTNCHIRHDLSKRQWLVESGKSLT